MPRRTTRSRASRAALLTTTAALALSAAGAGLVPGTASADSSATTLSLFPTDLLTVPDAQQLTGKRIALPTTGCGAPSACGLVERLNQLDGWDLDPRLALRFSGPVDVADVIASTTVSGGGTTHGIDRVVLDPATHTVYAHPVRQLAPGTTYTIAVSAEHGLTAASTTFTTLSATRGVLALREQLDSGAAYDAAGIPLAERGLKVDAIVPTDGAAIDYAADLGSGPLKEQALPVLFRGKVVFGSYLAPTWLDGATRTIAQTPTGGPGPAVVGKTRLPFVALVPAGTAPAGGWPVAVFGHGFSRSNADVFLAAEKNAANGIATIATDVVGHGYGPRSAWVVDTPKGAPRTLPAYARGIDQNGDGVIGSTEGSSAAPGTPEAAVSSRDALRQTSADVMALVRAVGRGVDLGGTRATDLRTTGVDYVGQSFGGIYGTMVAGSDPKLDRAVLNVAGGPVLEIARLAPVFRPLITQSLAGAGLLNSQDPARAFFQEDLPLRGQAPVLAPVAGALPIQQFLASATWLSRPGSPETYAPLVPKTRALFQVAIGDQTVPNPTTYTLLDAGDLFGRSVAYRNDRTAQKGTNPHGFLLDLFGFPQGHERALDQVVTFFTTGNVVDPDGSGRVWQKPAPRFLLETLNFPNPAFPQG